MRASLGSRGLVAVFVVVLGWAAGAGCGTPLHRVPATTGGRLLPAEVGALWIRASTVVRNGEVIRRGILWQYITTPECLEFMDSQSFRELALEVLQGVVEAKLSEVSKMPGVAPGFGKVWDCGGVREPYRHDREVLLSLYMIAFAYTARDTCTQAVPIVVKEVYESTSSEGANRSARDWGIAVLEEREGWTWSVNREDSEAAPECPVTARRTEEVLRWKPYGTWPKWEKTWAFPPEVTEIGGQRFFAVRTANAHKAKDARLQSWYAAGIGLLAFEQHTKLIDPSRDEIVVDSNRQELVRVFIPSTGFYWRRELKPTGWPVPTGAAP